MSIALSAIGGNYTPKTTLGSIASLAMQPSLIGIKIALIAEEKSPLREREKLRPTTEHYYPGKSVITEEHPIRAFVSKTDAGTAKAYQPSKSGKARTLHSLISNAGLIRFIRTLKVLIPSLILKKAGYNGIPMDASPNVLGQLRKAISTYIPKVFHAFHPRTIRVVKRKEKSLQWAVRQLFKTKDRVNLMVSLLSGNPTLKLIEYSYDLSQRRKVKR